MPQSPTLIRIGTRGSELALAQAREVAARLAQAHGASIVTEVVVISTQGDRVLDRPLAEIGGKGLFTAEIEEQLADGRIDIAVHSSKDMPTLLPDGLHLSCFLPREAVADAFLSPVAETLADLPHGALLGTSSLRRQALVRRKRPDLAITGFRGNVQTRLRKLSEGVANATLLAQAGLNRLGLSEKISSLMPLDEFPPAPGQGAIGIETRVGDTRIDALLKPIGDTATATALGAERAFLAALDGSCRTPLAGYAMIDDGKVHFHGLILQPDGSRWHESRQQGTIGDAKAIGFETAAILRAEAGPGFFDGW